MMDYICTKFHENILNGIRVMERTQKVNGRTDGRTYGGHDIIRPIFDGRIKICILWNYMSFFLFFFFKLLLLVSYMTLLVMHTTQHHITTCEG